MTRPSFSAIVTAHGNTDCSEILVNLATQTVVPDEVILLHSDLSKIVLPGNLLFPVFVLPRQPNRNDWGHEKRSIGLSLAQKEFVGFFNHDDQYTPDYIEKMLNSTCPKTGFVYCYWNGRPCRPVACSSTSGNFIVRRSLAESVGGWKGRHYEADGEFINEVVAEAKNQGQYVVGVAESLYQHNVR